MSHCGPGWPSSSLGLWGLGGLVVRTRPTVPGGEKPGCRTGVRLLGALQSRSGSLWQEPLREKIKVPTLMIQCGQPQEKQSAPTGGQNSGTACEKLPGRLGGVRDHKKTAQARHGVEGGSFSLFDPQTETGSEGKKGGGEDPMVLRLLRTTGWGVGGAAAELGMAGLFPGR